MKHSSIQEQPISFTNSASYDLGLLIANWLSARPQRSQRLLASRTQVGLASINRLVAPFLCNEADLNAEIHFPENNPKQIGKVKKLKDAAAENKSIGLDLVLKLLPEITNYSGMIEFLQLHFPKQGDLFRKLFGDSSQALNPRIELLPLCKHLVDSDGFTIMTMVATHSGVHRSKIIYRLGQRGLDKLEDLKKDGLVLEDNAGFLKAVEPDFSVTDLDTLVAQVSHIAENIKRTRKGLLTIQSEGLNDEGVDRVQNLIRETSKQIEAILKEKQYRGNRTIAINLQQAFID